MTDAAHDPAQVLDALQQELREIDDAIEGGDAAADTATEEDLRLAAVLAMEARFSTLSGEVADDLLADEDTLPVEVRARLTKVMALELVDRQRLAGPLEPILVWERDNKRIEIDDLARSLATGLTDATDEDDLVIEDLAAVMAQAETGRRRFDELHEKLADDLVARWITTLEIEPVLGLAALERSLPELAGSGFRGGDNSGQRRARDFVKRVAQKLGLPDNP